MPRQVGRPDWSGVYSGDTNAVMLNLFQHPRAVICSYDTVFVAAGRAWILKQVQDDGEYLSDWLMH